MGDIIFSSESHLTTPEKIKFLNPQSKLACEMGEHAVLGVSPFNSYFKEETLVKMIDWARTNFSSYSIYIPTQLYKFNFKAIGYSSPDSERKTEKQDRYLVNKVKRAISALNISQEAPSILTTEHLNTIHEYQNLVRHYSKLYETDIPFREIVNEGCRWALGNPSSNQKNKLAKPQVASRYILHELPVILNTTEIINHNHSVFVYNKTPNFIDSIHQYLTEKSYNSTCLFSMVSFSTAKE